MNAGVVVKRFYGGGDSDDRFRLSLLSPEDFSPKVLCENLDLPSFIDDLDIECGSCCGLLYLDDCKGNILLCNLTTKELKLLPPPPHELLPFPSHIEFEGSGLGYDSKSDDFKVIRIFERNYYKEVGQTKKYRGNKDQCELYSLKSGVWKYIPAPDAVIMGHIGFHVGGSCYWIASLGKSFGGRSTGNIARDDILSFDFTSESFHCLHVPPYSENLEVVFHLVEYDGLLGAIAFDRKIVDNTKGFGLWVRKESSWSKIFDILLSNVDRPLGLKDGRFLFLTRRKNCNKLIQLLVYDWITRELKELDIYDYPGQMLVTFYVEGQFALPDARPMQRSYTLEEEEEINERRRKRYRVSCEDDDDYDDSIQYDYNYDYEEDDDDNEDSCKDDADEDDEDSSEDEEDSSEDEEEEEDDDDDMDEDQMG